MSCICHHTHTHLAIHTHTRTSVMKTFIFYGEAGLNCFAGKGGCSLWVADSSADLSGLLFRLPVCLSLSVALSVSLSGGIGLYRSDSGGSCQLVSLNRHQNHLPNHLSVVSQARTQSSSLAPPSCELFTAYQHRHRQHATRLFALM